MLIKAMSVNLALLIALTVQAQQIVLNVVQTILQVLVSIALLPHALQIPTVIAIGFAKPTTLDVLYKPH